MEFNDQNYQIKKDLCSQTIELIQQGYKVIGEEKSEKAIVIMGETGVGKSSLAAALAGIRLKAEKANGVKFYQFEDPTKNKGLKIGDPEDLYSETKIPVKVSLKDGQVIIYDLPGFNDTDQKQEIANAFYIQRILETRGGLKILLVIPDCDLGQKAINFIKTVEHFAKMFKNPKILAKSLTLIISKIDIEERTIENIQHDVKRLLGSDRPMTPQAKTILGFLVKSIALFPKPPLPPDYFEENEAKNPILSTIQGKENNLNGMEKREYYQPEPKSMNVVVSEECKKTLVLELFAQRSKNFIDCLADIASKIEGICTQIASKRHKQNSQNKLQNYFLVCPGI